MQGENMEDENEENLNNGNSLPPLAASVSKIKLVHKMPDTQCVQNHGNKKRWDQLYELVLISPWLALNIFYRTNSRKKRESL
jgi:hypothetical protein